MKKSILEWPEDPKVSLPQPIPLLGMRHKLFLHRTDPNIPTDLPESVCSGPIFAEKRPI
jgi:hypothetical protein